MNNVLARGMQEDLLVYQDDWSLVSNLNKETLEKDKQSGPKPEV